MTLTFPHVSRIVLAGSLGFILGIAFSLFVEVQIDFLLLVILFCAVGSFFIFYKKPFVFVLIVFVLLFGLGALTAYNVTSEIAQRENNVGGILNGNATVIGDVVQKDWYSQVVAQYDDEITVLIKDDKYTSVVRGDILNLKCTATLPENFEDFDYQKYLAMKGIDYICTDVDYEVVGHIDTFLSRLAQVRMYLENIVSQIIPAPESALANGLLFGGDDRLSEDIQQKFSLTGMTHIVAVSGYNVSIIVMAVMVGMIFVGFKRQYAIFIAVLGVLLFVALIGFPSSGVRAAIMGVMVLMATLYGRVSHMYGAILVTCAVMLLYNPLLLRYDIGFQLSFLATLGIVAVYPLLQKIFVKNNASVGVLEILLMTISAQIFVLPIIIYHFHILSIVSLLVNMLVLPILPITMLVIFLMLVAHFVFVPISAFLGWVAYFLLAYEMRVIDFFAQLSWSSVEVANINVLWFVVYYGLLIGIIFIFNRVKRDEI